MYDINKKDLNQLNSSYHNSNSSIHFIFGGSKSGKTTLIKNFVVKKNYIYFCFSPSIDNLLYARLGHIISQGLKLKNSSYFFKTLNDVLLLLEKEVLNEKKVLILDDFHELLKINKYALNLFITSWNKKLKYKNLQIIILSSIKFNNEDNKLIKPYKNTTFYMNNIPFSNISNIKSISKLDKLYIYSFFGTSDLLLDYYDTRHEFIKNVYLISLQPSSPFFYYGINYLKKDISDISTYCSILYSISKGKNKIGDIASFIDLKATHLSRYIQKLLDLFIIEKRLPLNDNFKNSKNGRYYIKDNHLRFWFFYVFDNISLLEMKKHRSIIRLINQTFINNFIIPSYKDYIYELINNNQEQYLGFKAINIGSWWDNNNYIDIVAYNDEQITFISVLWDSSDKAKLHYGILKNISDNYKTTLKRNYIIISKNTYMNIN